jgi:hypothetical protein
MSEKSQNEMPQVGAVDSSKQNSPILDEPLPEERETTRKLNCFFNGAEFATGAEVCSGGVQLRCYHNGTWYRVGTC